MNRGKQFWTLLRFQAGMNPMIWIWPFVCGIPLLIPLISGSASSTYHAPLDILFINQNLFFVGIIGMAILAPEKFQFGSSAGSNFLSNEFLLTRAIDRTVFYRSKAALLFILVGSFPLFNFAHAAWHPDLLATEYSMPVQQEILAAVPGSALVPDRDNPRHPSLLSLPRGNVLISEFEMTVFVVTALVSQLLILGLYPFRFGKWIFWLLFFALSFAPILFIGSKGPPPAERAFFVFARHEAWSWIALGVVFVLTQLWCGRRFRQLEQ